MTEGLFAGVVGQAGAIAALEAAAARPVHAYLFVGPPGTGRQAAARGFAAALLCPAGRPPPAGVGRADGTCDTCRRVRAGLHPDVTSIEREGASISIGTAREVGRSAALTPVEGDRKVIVLHDFHLVRDAGPALLKVIEEPPPSTVFVILAEYLPPELVTIASRCVRIDFRPLTAAEVVGALEADGIPAPRAAELAAVAGGRIDRARLLAADPRFDERRRAWHEVPGRLDGSGATAAGLADELVALLDASVDPLRARHDAERAALEERNARAAEVGGSGRGAGRRKATKAALGSGLKELEERQRREQRRQRVDELRAGLAILAGAYRDRLAAAPDARRRRPPIEAVGLIDRLAADLEYNPGELLALQALLSRLGQAAGA